MSYANYVDVCLIKPEMSGDEIQSTPYRIQILCRKASVCSSSTVQLDGINVLLGQYESMSMTVTTDRVCDPISVCEGDEYESASPQMVFLI
eukprot:m.248975 g.248975  ORF g.248975 m.248975 type:complete len:91 (+) comp16139_c2_seq1:1777-2049(+)